MNCKHEYERLWFGVMPGLVFVFGSMAVNAEPATFPPKLPVCVACHGADGIGKAQQYPNLRGQKAYYLEKQMKAFRSGARQDPVMTPLVQSLSDAEIEEMAVYFSALD